MDKNMRNDRIYKSLPLSDFMEQCSFIVAKGGYYLLPLIQNMNYVKKLNYSKGKTEDDLKVQFIEKVKKELDVANVKIKITDTGKFYDVWTEIKE